MKLKYWLMLVFTIGLIWFGFYTAKKEIQMLDTCSNETTAIVIDNYRLRKKGYTVKYSYEINQVTYNTSETIKASEKNLYTVGDTISIKYSCEDHNVSSIIKKP